MTSTQTSPGGIQPDSSDKLDKRVLMVAGVVVLGATNRPDFDVLINPQSEDARARAETLRNRYKMDPALMKETNEKFGPLDAEHFGRRLHELVTHFLHDAPAAEKKHEAVRS